MRCALTGLFTALILMAASSSAHAGTVAFSFINQVGNGLNGLTGIISGVGSDGTFSPTDVTVTAFSTSFFNGASTRAAPFSASSWNIINDTATALGSSLSADTITLTGGTVTAINIELTELSSSDYFLLFSDAAPSVNFEIDLLTLSGISTATASEAGTLVNYAFTATEVPEPASLALLGGMLVALAGVSRYVRNEL